MNIYNVMVWGGEEIVIKWQQRYLLLSLFDLEVLLPWLPVDWTKPS